MSKAHHKHVKLPKPAGGSWGRSEFSLIGAPCPVIEEVVQWLSGCLPAWNIGYADATHGEGEADVRSALRFTSGSRSFRMEGQKSLVPVNQRQLFQHCDLVLVNGNHFTAQQQVLLLHPGKSLEQKLDRLTDVRLIIRFEASPIPEYLAAYAAVVPVLDWDDKEGLRAFFDNYLRQQVPQLNGLVLLGGQSLRMGNDKSLLQYHGKPQRDHLYQMLQPLCVAAYASCNAAQAEGLQMPLIEDRFLGIGPMGGLLTALQSAPDRAWLAVACDMPFLQARSLDYLIANRDPSKLATAFRNPEEAFPEPLVTIWEPRAYPALLQALAAGITCPRKVLMASDIALLDAPEPGDLRNVNDVAAYRDALSHLAYDPSTKTN